METTGLDRLENRIVSIGCTCDGIPKIFMAEKEEDCIRGFFEYVDAISPNRFVGFNNHLFDDPFLFFRTISSEVDSGFSLFGYNNSVDLRVLLTEFKIRSYTCKKGTLVDFCRMFGIDVADDDCDGSVIPDLWRERKEHPENIQKIKEHAIRDVERTWKLYCKVRRFL